MRIKVFIILYLSFIIPDYCLGTLDTVIEDSIRKLTNTGAMYFYAGDFEQAETYFVKNLHLIKETFPENHPEIADAYNNLGVLNKNKWQFELALKYLNNAKTIYEFKKENKISLANVYSNIGNVYHHKGDYVHAEEYYNKSLIYLDNEESSLASQRRAEVLNRYALLEIERKNFSLAIQHVKDGIKTYNNGKNINSVILHNLFITGSSAFNLNNNPDSSLILIEMSIKLLIDDENYSKQLSAESFLNLSEYYLKQEKYDKAIEAIKTTENIFNHSSIDSVLYFDIVKLYAKYFELIEDYESAIPHYNKANQLLIQKKNTTNNREYASVIKAIALLKDKTNCLINWYYADQNKVHLVEALNDLKTIADLIDKARSGYLSIESKLQLAENEDAIYKMGIKVSYSLYEITQQSNYIEDAFFFAEKGKSSVLLDALNNEKAKSFANIPDSLLQAEHKLQRELAFYKEKVYEEELKSKPDSTKLKTWKNYLFEFSQKNEQITQILEKKYPDYYNFKYKKQSINIKEIQKKLRRNSSLIEYSTSDSILYTFVINKNEAYLYKSSLDDNTLNKIITLINQFKNFNFAEQGNNIVQEYEANTASIYENLMGFIDAEILNENLLIVPDGIFSYIPFEALVYHKKDKLPVSFGELNYLLYKHSVFYSYSATLYVKAQKQSHPKLWNKTLAVAPDYNYSTTQKVNTYIESANYRDNLLPLPYAQDEVRMIAQITHGDLLLKKEATEEYFNKVAPEYDILHLAMHTLIDDQNPLYSKLVFYNEEYTQDEGLLTTNEIFSLKLKANLTILSACSSGEGDFKKGEGVMSLSRGFFYAGCPSLIMTLWKVEDESGLQLMRSFYRNLLKGYSKTTSLKKAKIEYIQTAMEQNKHPFFWSSYILIGNPSPLYISKWIIVGTLIFIIVLIFVIKKKLNKRIDLPEPTLN